LEAEPLAREHVEQLLDIKIDECGLMIDFATPYLGCSPDGIISDVKGIVEIKCPASAKDMTISEAIKNKKIDYLEVVNNEVKNLKQNHNYHFQVQGQLHIMQKEYCLFIIYTEKECKIEIFLRVTHFGKQKWVRN
jgi:hypothetical protein